MRIRLLKSVLAWFLIFAVLFSVSLTVFAAQSVNFTLLTQTADNGEITVKVQFASSDKKSIAFSGYSFSIFCDAQAVSYVKGSEVYGLSALASNAEVYQYSDSQINAAWYGDEISMSSGAILFTFKL